MENNDHNILPTELLKSKIYEGLSCYQDPYLMLDLKTAGCIKQLIIHSRKIILNVQLGFILAEHTAFLYQKLKTILDPIIQNLAQEVGIEITLEINIKNKILPHAYNHTLDKITNIKNIIAVGSGKGGVGKSTIAVNLAMALKKQGANVGILDADLYGPSLPHMLNCPQKAKIINKKLQPHLAHGLYCISIGNLLEQEDDPLVWRGPMVSAGLLQLIHDTIWPELDYLIIDLPPGTGDIQLTLAQKIPVNGAIIVTTPQQVAVLDAQKALIMLQKLNIPILGIIENMSYLICSHCHKSQNIFGTTGGSSMADKYNIRMLGEIPLDETIRTQSDLGIPTVLALPNNNISKIYHQIATNTAAQLSMLPIDLKIANTSIIIE